MKRNQERMALFSPGETHVADLGYLKTRINEGSIFFNFENLYQSSDTDFFPALITAGIFWGFR